MELQTSSKPRDLSAPGDDFEQYIMTDFVKDHTNSEISYGTICAGDYEGNDLCNSAIDDYVARHDMLHQTGSESECEGF